MTTLRRFTPADLFHFNRINLDPLTETYNLSFYLTYLAHHPSYFTVALSHTGTYMGYIMGKAEGEEHKKEWHGHVTALTVAPEFRRCGVARTLMKTLEDVSEQIYDTFFVDLFVRKSNSLAISMYEGFGYKVFRRVRGYYTGPDGEDALDMRKALPRDTNGWTFRGMGKVIDPEDLEW
ncbi:N(alpha)-acetyltransferase 20, NatB catalytic subunit [Gaertneriomyces sp. JEL0708]|nr:N(alpha)-acetyltransferase 20, NatB catalytic subunit [Gaertneriomyces sp. JEL0708]